MEALPYRGRKAGTNQVLAFPRLPYQYRYVDKGTPDAVKAAQIEFALWLSDDVKQTELAQRMVLQAQGVKAFSIGDLSETYKEGSNSLLCPKAFALLSQYLNGGLAMC